MKILGYKTIEWADDIKNIAIEYLLDDEFDLDTVERIAIYRKAGLELLLLAARMEAEL